MTAAPDLTVLGSGVLQPIEQEAIRWLAQRRADQGIWLREHNATLTVRRLSDDLFDLELHTKVTDPDSSLKLAHPSKSSFTQDACFEFARDGLIDKLPPSTAAREIFFQVVTAAMKQRRKG
jgi:cytochrome P450